MLHNNDLICSGELRKYDPEQSLEEEMVPQDECQKKRKPGKDLTGVDPEVYQYLTTDDWYSFCERQNLQYGPHFRTVTKYSVDRTWSCIRSDLPFPKILTLKQYMDDIF